MIKLQIHRREENPKYKSQNHPYDNRTEEEKQFYINQEVLEVEITDKQFEVIRKEVLKTF